MNCLCDEVVCLDQSICGMALLRMYKTELSVEVHSLCPRCRQSGWDRALIRIWIAAAEDVIGAEVMLREEMVYRPIAQIGKS